MSTEMYKDERPEMTLFQEIYDFFVRMAGNMNADLFNFLIQETLVVLIPACLCAVTWSKGLRIVTVQTVLLVIGVLIAISLPMDRLKIESGVARLWISLSAVLLILFVPPVLSYLVLPLRDSQRLMTQTLYWGLLVLALTQLLEVYLR